MKGFLPVINFVDIGNEHLVQHVFMTIAKTERMKYYLTIWISKTTYCWFLSLSKSMTNGLYYKDNFFDKNTLKF